MHQAFQFSNVSGKGNPEDIGMTGQLWDAILKLVVLATGAFADGRPELSRGYHDSAKDDGLSPTGPHRCAAYSSSVASLVALR